LGLGVKANLFLSSLLVDCSIAVSVSGIR
jgi:hypothetical protein